MAILTWEGSADEEVPNFCPQGCGGISEDPYGGPCQRCWDAVGSRHADDDDDYYRQSTTACCPRQTIPDSCGCPDGCACLCRDCDCGTGCACCDGDGDDCEAIGDTKGSAP
jgi:hypothetical protein